MTITACSLAALTYVGWWSFAPIALPQPSVASFNVDPPHHSEKSDTLMAALDTSAFGVQLWVPAPNVLAEESVEVSPAPPPPELILLAITKDDGQRIAALYDKRQNRVFLAQVGDTVANIVIADITDSVVELLSGERRSQLVLRKDKS